MPIVFHCHIKSYYNGKAKECQYKKLSAPFCPHECLFSSTLVLAHTLTLYTFKISSSFMCFQMRKGNFFNRMWHTDMKLQNDTTYTCEWQSEGGKN
jgi:hypothetical protein